MPEFMVVFCTVTTPDVGKKLPEQKRMIIFIFLLGKRGNRIIIDRKLIPCKVSGTLSVPRWFQT